MKFRRAEAVIYAKTEAFGYYRLAYRLGGRRVVRTFRVFSEARQAADAAVRQISAGDPGASMSGAEAREAIVGRGILAELEREIGMKVSLSEALVEYRESRRLLGNRSLIEAVKSFLATSAAVKRVRIDEAVKQYLEDRRPETVAAEGKRPSLAPKYFAGLERWLGTFARTFPGHSLCDLQRLHVDTFMRSRKTLVGVKVRNDMRAALAMFFRWSVRHDLLAPNHRLLEADGLRREPRQETEIDPYSASELRLMLEASDGALRAMIAIEGLAGLRNEEALRLDWADVWRVPGHIEISSAKSKTRSRRLAEICPALERWIEPYRGMTGKVWGVRQQRFHEAFVDLRERVGVPTRRNGLRSGFISSHFAARANEGLTAQQAGTSPGMVFAHYRGLRTRSEGEAWFAVAPATRENVIALEREA